MSKKALLRFALIFAGLTGAELELGPNRALATDDCITQSNVVPPKGSRWSYRIDRATNRTCWFLMKAATAPAMRRTSPRSKVARVPPEHREPSNSGQQAQRTREMSESEQAALFLEFLRWKEHLGAVNSSNAVEPQGRPGPN